MDSLLNYFLIGWEHIVSLDALDHQLFLLALVLPYQLGDWKKILLLVTAFTIGHSLTLFLAATGTLQLPTEWVEFLIPVTIVLTAAENLIFQKRRSKNYWMVYGMALFFGLIHGLGFANTASMLLMPGESLVMTLLMFNIGVEAGQIVIVTLMLMLLTLLKKWIAQPKWVTVTFSVLCAGVAAFLAFSRFPL